MSSFADHGFPTIWQFADEGRGLRYFGCVDDFLVRSGRLAVSNVFHDGGWEERNVLVNQTN